MADNDMTWQQKHAAIKALSGPLRIFESGVKDGEIFVLTYAARAEGGFEYGVSGHGMSLPECIEALWRNLTEIADGAHIVVSSTSPVNADKRLRWNGFMWQEVTR